MTDEIFKVIDNQEFIHAEMYSETNVPHVCYHYTSPDGLLGILRDNKCILWFTRYDSLNDIGERTHIVDFLKEYCDSRVKNKTLSKAFCDEILKLTPSDIVCVTVPANKVEEFRTVGETDASVMDSVYCDTYLCCFSEQPDLLPMWNYYSKSNRYEGYSIGFFRHRIVKNNGMDEGYSITINKVIYDDNEKNSLFDKMFIPLNNFYNVASDIDKIYATSIAQRIINKYQFVFKKSCFQHEKEIRAILQIPRKKIDGGTEFEIKYRNSHGYIVPFVEYAVDTQVVGRVTSAPMLNKDLAEKNINEILKRRGYINGYAKPSEVPIRF